MDRPLRLLPSGAVDKSNLEGPCGGTVQWRSCARAGGRGRRPRGTTTTSRSVPHRLDSRAIPLGRPGDPVPRRTEVASPASC